MFSVPDVVVPSKIVERTDNVVSETAVFTRIAGAYLTPEGDIMNPADAASDSHNRRKSDHNGETPRTRGKSSNG